jgi:hypothetical protein
MLSWHLTYQSHQSLILVFQFFLFFCHFLLAQKVTKKGTTNANRLIGLVAQGYTPGPTNLTVRTVRGQATRRQNGKFVCCFTFLC